MFSFTSFDGKFIKYFETKHTNNFSFQRGSYQINF